MGSSKNASQTGPPVERREPLTSRRIVDAGIRLADAHGLDAVSIRRVAAELGARPMSLYTHIRSKDSLLDLMTDGVIGTAIDSNSVGGDASAPWRELVSDLARGFHRALTGHPWLAAAFRQGRQPGPHTMRYAREMANAIAGAGLPPEIGWTALGVLNDYTLGHALRAATAGHADTLGTDSSLIPHLEALTAVDRARSQRDSFELGLAVVLDGIEARFVSGQVRHKSGDS